MYNGGFEIFKKNIRKNVYRTNHLDDYENIMNILTRAWTLGGKQQCEVSMSISLFVTQPWSFEINTICLDFGLSLCNLCIFSLNQVPF